MSGDRFDSLRLRPRPKYWSLLSYSARIAMSHRLGIALGILTNLVWLIIQYSLWKGVFATHERIGSFDWASMQTYVLLAFSVNVLLSSKSEERLYWDIRSGGVAITLARPLNFMGSQLAQSAGIAMLEGAVALSTCFILALTLVQVAPPASAAIALAFVVSVLLGFVVKFLLGYLIALLGFRLLNVTGLLWMRMAIVNIFSGALLPLDLFPPPLRALALFLPFRGIISTPLTIYLHTMGRDALLSSILHQIVWIFVLWFMTHRMWKASVGSLVLQGG